MEIKPSVFWSVVLAIVAIGLGIFANPWLTTRGEILATILKIQASLALCWLGYEYYRARRRSLNPPVPLAAPLMPPDSKSLLTLGWIYFCWLLLFRKRWTDPRITGDDWDYLKHAGSWVETQAALLTPYNEHLVVPTRIWTYLLNRWFEPHLAEAMSWSAIPLFALAFLQLYWLARRRFRSEFAAMIALTVFSITPVYREIVLWYSASQWLIAFNLLLLSLNLAESELDRPRFRRLLTIGAVCAAAPFCFSFGLLVGPITAVWIAAGPDHAIQRGERLRFLFRAAVPVLGTLAGAAIAAPILANWVRSDEYWETGGRGVKESFELIEGLLLGTRLSVDLLLLGNAGFEAPRRLNWIAPACFPIFAIAIVAALRFHPQFWRTLPALAAIVFAYGATLPFRAWVQYSDLLHWTRYQLAPQLGVALLVAGAAAAFYPANNTADRPGTLTSRQMLLVTAIAAAMLARHWRSTGYG